jgi:hypothetical protein
MKKKILLAIAFTTASLVCVTHQVWTNVSGAPGPYTNAPTSAGKELNCLTAGCHVGNPVNAAGGTLSIKLLDGTTEVNEWLANKTYNVNVIMSKAGAAKYGFEISAKRGTTSSNMGSLKNSGTGTQFAPFTNSTYLTHSATATGNWTFQWTAPAASSDAVTFYVAGNAANGDNNTTGDFIYSTSKTIASSSSAIGETDPFSSTIRVRGNPVSNYLIVDFDQAKQENAAIKIYTLQGKEIRLPVSFQGNGLNKRFVVETASLDKGMYIFSLQSGNNHASKKFLRE